MALSVEFAAGTDQPARGTDADLVSRLECEAFVKMLARAANLLLTADVYRLPAEYRGLQSQCCKVASDIGTMLEEFAR